MSVSSAVSNGAGAQRRVLIVSASYPDGSDDVSGVFVEDQAIVLARRFDVLVYVPRFLSVRGLVPGRKLPSTGVDRQRGVTVRREWTFMPPLCTRFTASLRAALRHASRHLCRAIEEWGRPDVIHAHVAFPAGWIATEAGRRLGIPVVLTEHSGPFSRLTEYAPQRPLVHEALSRAHRVLAVSPALADQIRAEFPELEIQVLGNVVRTDLFTPAGDRAPSKIATVAAVALLNRNKGIDVLIDAFALLPGRDARATRLVISGDGPERSSLERQARSRGIHDRCEFTGMVSREAVAQLLQRCDVFVLPSLGETFGLVLAEAMACGTPAIATRCGGPEFFVTPESGIFVPVGDATALAEALSAVLDGTWRATPQAGRREIDGRFGPDAFLRGIAAIYEHAARLAPASGR